MIEELRAEFNRRYTDREYKALVESVSRRTRTALEVRLCETPVFLPRPLVDTMVSAGEEMVRQLVNDPEYMDATEAAIPSEFRVQGAEGRPNFLQVDFGLIRNAAGEPEPRLVELQGFPSVYGFQQILSEEYLSVYDIGEPLTPFLAHANADDYWKSMKQVIVGDHDPSEVVLLEVEPERQKTVMDFRAHQDRLGIGIADIAKVVQKGRQLFYERGGVMKRIRRIYNRAIADELIRKGIQPGFEWTGDLDTEWAGHPNWYFRLSKFSLPWINHRFAPRAVFLDQWMAGERLADFPQDRDRWVLKPLYSFAGKGIEFAPTDERLSAIPSTERRNWLLQERVDFVPTIDTPWGPTQTEIRIMYLWPDDGEMTAVLTLARMGRGQMMGVDHNRNQLWVGGSAGLVLNDPISTK